MLRDNDKSIGVEMSDEELMEMMGGFSAAAGDGTDMGTTIPDKPIVMYGIFPDYGIGLKYGVQPFYGVTPKYGIHICYGIEPACG